MRATKIIPEDYHYCKTLNLSSPRVALWLNLAAVPLLFLFGWLFGRLIIVIRSLNPFPNGILHFFTTVSGWKLLAFPLSILLMLLLHELVHGLFFWLFTRERPKFALRAGYAFAAAPEWYLPAPQYIIVGLSPFLIISLLSILLAAVSASSLVVYLLFIATFNAAGALGDLIVVAWVMRQTGP
ncbi:MAG: DUF3267 domain-containing protein, partial [Acidobacteriaceae bacterium]